MKMTFVDVFATERLKGNNAAVCFVEGELDGAWMQALAAELAQPVTAFVDPKTLRLRWFAPKVELPLCGHGTLAAAHALWDAGAAEGALSFSMQGGVLTAQKSGELIEIDLPASPPRASAVPDLAAILGKRPLWVGEGGGKILALLDSEKSVRELSPNLEAIERLPAAGVVVTAMGEEKFDFISRYFSPAHGVGEDPVTGSSHAVLAPFWAERLAKRTFVAYQASKRGGVVHVRLEGGRAIVGGSCVTLLRGELA